MFFQNHCWVLRYGWLEILWHTHPIANLKSSTYGFPSALIARSLESKDFISIKYQNSCFHTCDWHNSVCRQYWSCECQYCTDCCQHHPNISLSQPFADFLCWTNLLLWTYSTFLRKIIKAIILNSVIPFFIIPGYGYCWMMSLLLCSTNWSLLWIRGKTKMMEIHFLNLSSLNFLCVW